MLFEKNRDKSLIELLRSVHDKHFTENCDDIEIEKFRISFLSESIYIYIDSEEVLEHLRMLIELKL